MKLNKNFVVNVVMSVLIALCIIVSAYGIYQGFYNINAEIYALSKKLDTLDTKLGELDSKMEQTAEDIKSAIELHSVHPVYGNYVKCDATGKSCNPWQYCPKNVYSQVYDLLLNISFSSADGKDSQA